MCSVGDESELQTTKLRFSQFLQDQVWLHSDVKKNPQKSLVKSHCHNGSVTP